MHILAIETSCDETAVAILRAADNALLADVVASQIDTHASFGGVVPEIAAREHMRMLPILVEQALRDAGLDWSQIDQLAVTRGPGLMGALLVGVSYARAAARIHRLPLLPIHHMEGHLLATGLACALPAFPFICLLVSGGHTMLVRVDAIGHYRLLGQTLDDAAGECFDKCARLLDCGYPGGPEIARLAVNGNASRFSLPRPMLNRDNLDFSFSGLKTAVLYTLRRQPTPDQQLRQDLAAAIEASIGDVLAQKSVRACRREGIARLVIAGGVAANRYLRRRLATLAEAQGITLYLPEPRHCTDNAAMIAFAASCRLKAGLPAPSEWDAMPRLPLANRN
ncbi:MAG: tRNA (adenosine(37)-N6)-threonylcarbamoyltransferase complex transferase subunit TsaD [Zetaproteobacteria bacterium]|nr:MAG: tRNA (adenosine(37)-N6)-threonylcarbamoyltransferase complex transferase subunit TsaD [Zetaproteobacteria bacterium]